MEKGGGGGGLEERVCITAVMREKAVRVQNSL